MAYKPGQSYSGVPTVLEGSGPRTTLYGQLAKNNPFWQQQLQANNAGGAWNVANEIMSPLKPQANDFGEMAKTLMGGVDMKNPGMGDEAFKAALKGIFRQGQKEKAGIAKALSAGGSVDPEALGRMFAKTSEGRMSAVSGAHMNRAALNQEAMQGLLQRLAPFFRTQATGQQAFENDLSGLFANILSSGMYTL